MSPSFKRLLSFIFINLVFIFHEEPFAGSIEGRVTDVSDHPVEMIGVSAWLWNGSGWDWAGQADSGLQGEFAIAGLEEGTYRVMFKDYSGTFMRETYNNSRGYSWDGGEDIPVGTDEAVTNINAQMDLFSRIEGRVTGPDDEPIEEIYVSVYYFEEDNWYWASDGYSDSEGFYSMGGLEARTYRVMFEDWSGTFMRETYDDHKGYPWDGGQDILVGLHEVITNINARMSSGSRIEGRVTDFRGEPIGGIYIGAYYLDGDLWLGAAGTISDAEGNYSLSALDPGLYRVMFEDFNGAYITETYDDHQDGYWSGGLDILVEEDAVVANINAQLERFSFIEGRVTSVSGESLEGIRIDALYWNGSWWSWGNSAHTDANGDYSMGGLLPNEYLVVFYDWNYGRYITQAYSNHHNSFYWDGGPYDPVLVGSSVTVSNINATMLEYATLSGVVYQSDGITPVANCLVVLRGYIDGYYESSTYTDENGYYYFDAVSPGSFALHAGPSGDDLFLAQWLGGVMLVAPFQERGWPFKQLLPPEGTTEVVVYGSDVDGRDFVLPVAGRISGYVRGAGVLPHTNASVIAYGYTNKFNFSARTDEDGAYEVRGLLPDAYQVKVEAPDFKDEWWDNAHHRSNSTMVVVNTGDHYELNFDLDPGQSPAYVEVISDPSGASIFLDYQPTGALTPSVLDVGEVGDIDWAGFVIASRVISLKKESHAIPVPVSVAPKEAETVEVQFDLTSTDQGGVLVETEPPGAMVYINRADMIAGTTPVEIGQLAPGSHTILLRKEGFLQPRPVIVYIEKDATNVVSVPLADSMSTNRMMVFARSVPQGAPVYVDYLATTSRTDVAIDWMDAASHAGLSWRSASHTIMVKRDGFRQTAPRYVTEEPGVMHRLMINMTVTPEDAIDADEDGIPDQIAEAYGLDQVTDAGKIGAEGDADGDGVSNINEIRAGTNPMNANDVLEAVTAPMPVGQQINFTFASIPGRSYVVMCSADLNNPDWTYASGVVVATETETTVTLTMAEGLECRFFRVVALSP